MGLTPEELGRVLKEFRNGWPPHPDYVIHWTLIGEDRSPGDT